jgi:hypothetical protein
VAPSKEKYMRHLAPFDSRVKHYAVTYQPNSTGRLRGLTQEPITVVEEAIGTKDAINKASEKFELDFRMVNHPGADGLATAYDPHDNVIVGQFTAKRQRGL